MKILALVGLSGCGKTFISEILKGNKYNINLDDDIKHRLYNIPLFDKYTTSTSRKPRKGEIHKVDYYFYDRQTFEDKIKNGDFVEYSEVYGNLYGLTKEEVIKKEKSDTPILLIMDPQGVETIRSINKDVVRVYIDVSLETITKRMKVNRKEDHKIIEERLKGLDYFYQYKEQCEYVIDGNKDINSVMVNILDIIEKEFRY